MNSFILGELMDELSWNGDVVTYATQEDVKNRILEDDCQDMFLMVSNEFTNDSGFTVDIDESKFLNDKSYDCTWLMGSDYDGYMTYLICLKSSGKILYIEAFEVNKDMRGEGIGANVISVIETSMESYYDFISVSPFDTDAINFWEHMEYEESNNGHWVKKL